MCGPSHRASRRPRRRNDRIAGPEFWATRKNLKELRPMYRVRQEDLPFKGSSYNFVGADNGDVQISAFLLSAQPGRGPGPHRHPYDEVQFIREGRGLYTVDGEEFEAGPGDILVIKAGEIHGFQCIGDSPLVQVDIHLNPTFIQENLG